MTWPPERVRDWVFLAVIAMLAGLAGGVGHAASQDLFGPDEQQPVRVTVIR